MWIVFRDFHDENKFKDVYWNILSPVYQIELHQLRWVSSYLIFMAALTLTEWTHAKNEGSNTLAHGTHLFLTSGCMLRVWWRHRATPPLNWWRHFFLWGTYATWRGHQHSFANNPWKTGLYFSWQDIGRVRLTGHPLYPGLPVQKWSYPDPPATCRLQL